MSQWLNIILILFAVLGPPLLFFREVIIRKHHETKLQDRFATWWLQIEDKNKLDVALACAAASNKLLNYIFGEKLLRSRKVWFRSFIFATCILVATLATVGLWEKQTYLLTPWQTYKDSVEIVVSDIDQLFSPKTMDYYRQVALTNVQPFYKDTNNIILTIHSNYYLVKVETNAIKEITQVAPLVHGTMTFYYHRITSPNEPLSTDTNAAITLGDVNKTLNELAKGARQVQLFAVKHSTHSDVVLYSEAYFVSLFLLNTILFVLSQGTCRIMLREIVRARTVAATASLLLTNVTVVAFLSVGAVAVFTLFALPIFWFFVPFIYYWSQESIWSALMYCICGSFGMWAMSTTAMKVLVLVAFLPSFFAFIVGLFSLIAMKWKSAFHFILQAVLIRCVEKNPMVVASATLIFISGLLAVVAKLMHLTAFL
jgi:hypothetical protein